MRMIKRILSALRLAPEDLRISLDYYDRQHRILAPPVESEASPAVSMMFYRPTPGHYVGLGQTVIAERRVENRPVQVERRRKKKKT